MNTTDALKEKPYILFESAELDENGIYISSDNVFEFSPHTHSYYEMTLYQPFDGVINVNGQNFDMNMVAPCVILITPSSFHQMTTPIQKASRYIKVAFSQDILTLSPSKIPGWPIILTQHDSDDFLVRLFHELLMHKDSSYYVSLLINAAVCLLAENGQKISPKPLSGEHSLAMKAVRIMNDHYDEHLTLNSIAELLSVSPPYLSHIFSRNVGMTYASYLCQLRLHHAARLLTDSSKAITDICYACGYRNLSHFLRSFKEQYGMTPKEYRHFTTESFPSSSIPSEETSDHYGLVITLEV